MRSDRSAGGSARAIGFPHHYEALAERADDCRYGRQPVLPGVGRANHPGRVGTLDIILFAEPVTAWRVVCLLLIVGVVVGLKFTAS